MKTNKIYKINNKLQHTKDTIRDLEIIYLENTEEFPPLLDDLVNILMTEFNEFERSVFLLYCEYQSLRKVSDETNVSHFVIYKIIESVKNKSKKIK